MYNKYQQMWLQKVPNESRNISEQLVPSKSKLILVKFHVLIIFLHRHFFHPTNSQLPYHLPFYTALAWFALTHFENLTKSHPMTPIGISSSSWCILYKINTIPYRFTIILLTVTSYNQLEFYNFFTTGSLLISISYCKNKVIFIKYYNINYNITQKFNTNRVWTSGSKVIQIMNLQ